MDSRLCIRRLFSNEHLLSEKRGWLICRESMLCLIDLAVVWDFSRQERERVKKGKKENTKQTAALACGKPPVRAGRAKFLPDYWESVTQHTHAQTASTRFHTSSGAKIHTLLRMSRQRRAQYKITTLIRKGKNMSHTHTQRVSIWGLCCCVCGSRARRREKEATLSHSRLSGQGATGDVIQQTWGWCLEIWKSIAKKRAPAGSCAVSLKSVYIFSSITHQESHQGFGHAAGEK